MSDLRDQISFEVHQFLRNFGYTADSAFKLELVDNCERLANLHQLTVDKLNKLPLPKYFFLANDVKKEVFVDQLFPFLKKYGSLSANKLRDAYDDFFERTKTDFERNHGGQIFNNGTPKEELGQHLLMAALTAFSDKNGFVYREVPSGAGRIDLIVAEKIEVIVETKLSRNFKGTKQLEDYVNHKPSSRRGYFVIFDHSKTNTHAKYCDVSNKRFAGRKRVKVVVIHINPPLPSTQAHKKLKNKTPKRKQKP
jgi:hypothetical protein